jgi:hypothetical protein
MLVPCMLNYIFHNGRHRLYHENVIGGISNQM